MIFGDCPYCDKPITNAMPDISPVVFENDCEHCGKTYWIYASRIEECMAYTQEDFKREFELDNENKSFRRKDA